MLHSLPATMKPSPVLLFTGAGASRPLDMPTMLEFESCVADKLTSEQLGLWTLIVEASAEAFGVASASVDIEQILTFIEECELSYCRARQLWKRLHGLELGTPTIEQFHAFREHLWTLRNLALDEICAVYREPDPTKAVDLYSPLFQMLTEVSGQDSTQVFTTNYDLTVEVLTRELAGEYELVDGFEVSDSGQEVSTWNYVPKFDGRHAIVLMKLHGSTSWKGKLPSLLFKKEAPSVYADGDWRTIIIYPTKNKRDTQHLFAKPFNQAYGALESKFSQVGVVRVLLVIGYAFGDEEVREIIEQGLIAEKNAHLIVVDPHATREQLSSKFCKVEDDRLRIIAGRFGEESTLVKIERELRSSLGMHS